MPIKMNPPSEAGIMRAQDHAVQQAATIMREAMRLRGLRQYELADLLKTSSANLSRMLSGRDNLTVRSVAKVLYTLGHSYQQRAASEAVDFNIDMMTGPAIPDKVTVNDYERRIA